MLQDINSTLVYTDIFCIHSCDFLCTCKKHSALYFLLPVSDTAKHFDVATLYWTVFWSDAMASAAAQLATTWYGKDPAYRKLVGRSTRCGGRLCPNSLLARESWEGLKHPKHKRNSCVHSLCYTTNIIQEFICCDQSTRHGITLFGTPWENAHIWHDMSN